MIVLGSLRQEGLQPSAVHLYMLWSVTLAVQQKLWMSCEEGCQLQH